MLVGQQIGDECTTFVWVEFFIGLAMSQAPKRRISKACHRDSPVSKEVFRASALGTARRARVLGNTARSAGWSTHDRAGASSSAAWSRLLSNLLPSRNDPQAFIPQAFPRLLLFANFITCYMAEIVHDELKPRRGPIAICSFCTDLYRYTGKWAKETMWTF